MSKYKIWCDEVEDAAMKQIKNVSSLPFIHKHVAIMPDVHAGYGCTVGSVIPTHKAVIPSAVGVDIGCGMIAAKTTLTHNDLPDSLSLIRSTIESRIPVGFSARDKQAAYVDINPTIKKVFTDYRIDYTQRHQKQLGTLGGGNHFIELCLDEHGDVWVMLHSGSRGIGNKIGSRFIELAKLEMEKWHIHLPDKDLSYLVEGSEHFESYIHSVSWAQEWARLNRDVMLQDVFEVLRGFYPDVSFKEKAINCHHNYVELENHYNKNIYVARKGAVRARKGDLGIIPGSMGAKSYIVRGKGEKSSFCSCSHGAGRVMSRTEARKRFTLDDHIKATEGVECRKDADVIDETPAAYKDIDKVMEDQKDLVEIIYTLKQVMCIKG